MFNSWRGHVSRWCFNARVKCISGEKATPILLEYMPKCVHFNYLILDVGDKSAEQKKHFETKQADEHEGSGFVCGSLFFDACPCFSAVVHERWCYSAKDAALCLSACEVVLHTERSSCSFRSSWTKIHIQVWDMVSLRLAGLVTITITTFWEVLKEALTVI